MIGLIQKNLILLTITLFAFGCGSSGSEPHLTPEEENISLSDSSEFLIDSAIGAISGVIDDQIGGLYLSTPCFRPSVAACENSERTMTYESCSLGTSGLSLNGTITLTYSAIDCNMATILNSVTRTYNYEIIGPRGGSLQMSSEPAQAYEGTSVSGGGRLTHIGDSQWQVELLGKHRTLSFGGQTIYDHSLRSGSPLTVTGSLNRSSRQVNGGSIEIFHNSAEYTLNLVPNNLTWNGGCHPSSGSLTGTLTGSLEGSVTITYTGMGQGQILIERPEEDEERSFEHSYCE